MLTALLLDPEWLNHVDQEAKLPLVDDAAAERAKLALQRKRLTRAYVNGDLEEREYLTWRDEIDSQIALIPPSVQELSEVQRRLDSFADLWTAGSAKFRNDVCQTLFEALLLDFDEKTVTVKPWPEFVPLFNIRVSYVRTTSPGPGCPNVKTSGLYTLSELGVAV